MDNFTINNYEMKREIVNFSKKISEGCNKAESKLVMDMIYGISKSKDILLLSGTIDKNYMNLVMDSLGDNPVFLIDDSDIIKPLGEKFENLGIVRDGSSIKKNIHQHKRTIYLLMILLLKE